LIVVDTGRHPAHVAKILDHAKARGRPIGAIVNSHWHMDHVQGNADIRAVHPGAQVYATSAVDGALATFLADGRKTAEARLKDPATPKERLPEVRRYLDRMADPDSVRPTRPVNASAALSIAGRTVDIRVAPFAVSEADIWLIVPEERMVIAGDLVVDIVPFMDTACVEGWSKALNEVAAVDFDTLIPGHGAPMSRAQFLGWKSAFDKLVECGRSDAKVAVCADRWVTNAAPYISEDKKTYAREAAAYYVEARFRSKPEEQRKFCAPLKA
jgi:glyoxylase-like metal-dependent hydrolase (beta-lactamase superfamily II)